jgi:hypothetical protein
MNIDENSVRSRRRPTAAHRPAELRAPELGPLSAAAPVHHRQHRSRCQSDARCARPLQRHAAHGVAKQVRFIIIIIIVIIIIMITIIIIIIIIIITAAQLITIIPLSSLITITCFEV